MTKNQAKILAISSLIMAGILTLNIILYIIVGEFSFEGFIVTGILPVIVVVFISFGLFILKKGTKTANVAQSGKTEIFGISEDESEKKATFERHAEENEDKENLSGLGEFVIAPPSIERRWNWGGFLLGWLWALGNKLPGYLILLSIMVPIIMNFYLGAKGNELAWKYKRWESVEHFKYIQRKWKIGGLIFYSALPLFFDSSFINGKIEGGSILLF
jgi:hypothetical protein